MLQISSSALHLLWAVNYCEHVLYHNQGINFIELVLVIDFTDVCHSELDMHPLADFLYSMHPCYFVSKVPQKSDHSIGSNPESSFDNEGLGDSTDAMQQPLLPF